MMLKKFIGATTRDALKRLREELGDNAVILSTKKTSSGTEVLAALPEDGEIPVSRAGSPTHAPQVPRQAQPAAQPVRPSVMEPQPFSWTKAERDEIGASTQHPVEPMVSVPLTVPSPVMGQELVEEIREMRQMLKEQMSMMSWKEAEGKNPLRSSLWRQLTDAGFSAVLARTVVEKLPDNMNDDGADKWLNDVMLRN